MKVIKVIFVLITVLSFVLSFVSVLNMDWDKNDLSEAPHQNVDTEKEQDQEPDLPLTSVRYCDCENCTLYSNINSTYYYIVDGHLGVDFIDNYQGSVTRLSAEDLYVGREVTLVSCNAFYFGDVLDGEDEHFTMDPGECFEIVLGEELWFWGHS